MKNGYNGNMNKLANIPSVALALTGISEGLPYLLPYLNDIFLRKNLSDSVEKLPPTNTKK